MRPNPSLMLSIKGASLARTLGRTITSLLCLPSLEQFMLRVAAGWLISLFVSDAAATCWKIENLRGYSAKGFERYEITQDGLKGQVFRLAIEASSVALSPSNGLSCSRVSSTSAVCAATDGTKAIVEVWSVDPSARKAYQVHSRTGSGQVNGGALFVGEITGSCE